MTALATPEAASTQARPSRGRSLLLPHLGLLATIVVWSAHATVMKFALRSVGPLVITSGRFLIGAVMLIGIGLLTRQPLLRRPPMRLLLPATAFGLVLNPLGFTFGVRYGTAVDVSVIMGLSPIVTAVLLFATTRRRLPARRLAGILLGFAGLLLVVLATAHRGPAAASALLGDVISLVPAAAWAVYILYAARAAGASPPIVFMVWSMVLAQVVLLPMMLVEAGQRPEAWLPALPWLLVSGILATGAGYLVYSWALPRVGIAETAVYTYLQPLLGALIGAAFLAEPFGIWQIGGAVTIVAAAYLGTWSGRDP